MPYRAARTCLPALLLLSLIGSGIAAVPGFESLNSGSHGLQLSVLQHGGADATLQAVASAAPGEPDGEAADEQARPFSSGLLWALPLGTTSATVQVLATQWRIVGAAEVPDSVAALVAAEPLPLVSISQVMRMRGVPLVSLAINALQPAEQGFGVRVCERLEFRIVAEGSAAVRAELSSPAVMSAMRGTVANLDDVTPAGLTRPEPYLIITRPAYNSNALSQFAAWKREKGHAVTIATTDQTGTTTTAIRSFIQNAYETWPEPPVFVLLVGDVDGANPLPGWIIDGFYTATDVTDHPYALVDGDDWLPDLFIGRFSVDSPNELQTIVNKTVQYESQPHEPGGAWRSRMLITGVRSSPGFYQTYNTAWPTLQWIGREFLGAGYAQIDSVPYPGGSASQINARINAGVSFVAYRGFGSPHDWAYPNYTNNDINALNNGAMLPLVMSIVCGGGAFDSEVDPCFGELWLRAGTPTNFKGAVAFIGPSELDTKTRWNNTNIAGIFEGILHENVDCAAAAMLRGKMELIRQFPNNVEIITSDSDRSPWFYFHVFNLLGDPGLNFFVGPVQDLAATIPDSVALGTPAMTIPITDSGTPLPGAWGTLRQSGTIVSAANADADGMLTFALPQATAGQYEITLSKPRHAVVRDTVFVGTRGVAVATSQLTLIDDGNNGSNGNGDQIPNPGERIALAIRLRNYGTQNFASGTLTVNSSNPELVVVSPSIDAPAILAGAESTPLYLTFDVLSTCPDGESCLLNWQINEHDFDWTSVINVASPLLLVAAVQADGQDLNPEPNSTAGLSLTLANAGHAQSAAGTVVMRSLDARLVVLDSTAEYPAIAPGLSAAPVSGFQITCGDIYPGDWAAVELVIPGSGGNVVTAYALPIGNLESADPTHPDSYGYRAFDDGDQAFDEAPEFAWLEVDPAYGGNGTPINIGDTGEGRDATVTLPLPFDFTFYGTTYSEFSVCSNGFVAFGATAESYLRNYRLPAIASPDNMFAAFWDDLSIPTGGRVLYYHDQQGGRFVIEWSRLRNEYGTQPEETFEVVLYDTECWPTRTGDGDLLVQYLNVSNSDSWDNYATVGIQSKTSGHSLLCTYANLNEPGVAPIRSNQCILFTTGRPQSGAYVSYDGNQIDDDQEGGSDGNGDGISQNGERLEVSIQLRNSGSGSAPASTGTLTSADSRITILDPAVSFPALGPGETVAGSPVRVQISPATPDGHVAGMLLQLTGGALPCVVIPTLTVAAPVLGGLPVQLDDDAVPPSNGNGNGEVNPLETLELFPGASNGGGNVATGVTAILRRLNTQVTILDSTAALGDIAVGGEQQATEPCVVRLNNGLGDGDQVQLRIVFRDAFGTEWTQNLSYLVGSPRLEAAGIRPDDPAPGGHGDGYLNGGETGMLYPQVSNSGLGSASGVSITITSADPSITLENATQIIGAVPGNGMRETPQPVIVHVQAGNVEPRAVPVTFSITADGGFHSTTQLSLVIGNAIYVADFESDLDRWTVFGEYSQWHLQTRSYASPSHAYYCGDESSRRYEANADGYLRSPAFTYNGHGRLIFSTQYHTASAGDYCRVQLQLGSSTYYLLGSFWGDQADWQQREYSLEGYPPAEIAKLRFWFTSDFLGQAEGWYVDDVIIVNEVQAVDNHPASPLPADYRLDQVYPNPFNDQTTIRYAVPRSGHVTISLFNTRGQRIANLIDSDREPGNYDLSWRPLSLASGIYFVRMEAPSMTASLKLVYLK
ncbi:T9SS type A sorting domain-containing protein [candidate division KSB1 bacterium]|nr:T9SS type A sorting domain-containing protein [candidate division KSB1 bacterium]